VGRILKCECSVVGNCSIGTMRHGSLQIEKTHRVMLLNRCVEVSRKEGLNKQRGESRKTCSLNAGIRRTQGLRGLAVLSTGRLVTGGADGVAAGPMGGGSQSGLS